MTTPKERPILYSAPMVRAYLDGTKTQTRRIIKPSWWRCLDPEDEEDQAQALTMCPYGKPGDRLWGRETFAPTDGDGSTPCSVIYRADDNRGVEDPAEVTWKPSIFMPRWASRMLAEVVSVRVERVQDISEEDAIAEGVQALPIGPDRRPFLGKIPTRSARDGFRMLWKSINGLESWEANPWVWVVEFKRCEVGREG